MSEETYILGTFKKQQERIADLEAELAAERKGHDTALETAQQNRKAYQKAEAELADWKARAFENENHAIQMDARAEKAEAKVERLKAHHSKYHEPADECTGSDWAEGGGRESGNPSNDGSTEDYESRSNGPRANATKSVAAANPAPSRRRDG